MGKSPTKILEPPTGEPDRLSVKRWLAVVVMVVAGSAAEDWGSDGGFGPG